MAEGYLCIGGPHDGKIIADNYGSFEVALLDKPPPLTASFDESLPELSYQTMRYILMEWPFHDGYVFRFWYVEGSLPSPGEIFERLVSGYAFRAKVRNVRKNLVRDFNLQDEDWDNSLDWHATQAAEKRRQRESDIAGKSYITSAPDPWYHKR